MAEESSIHISKDYLEKLEKKVSDLQTLIDVSAIISSTLDFNDLMTLIMEKAKNVMDAEACSILLHNRETNKLEFQVVLSAEETTSEILKKKVTLDIGQGIAGWVAENEKALIVKDAQSDSRFSQEADRQTGFTTRSLIAVPLVGRTGLIGVAEILNPRKKVFFSSYDAEIFQTLSRQVAIAIENAYFHRESIERERLRQELEIASVVQRSFLPQSPVFRRGDVAMSAVNISAKKVGGDIYDFIEPVEGQVGVLIGDVSGKGISAALYMAKTISDFRYIALQSDSTEATFKQLNVQMMNAPRGMFLTAMYLIIDAQMGTLTISVAGHPPLIWISGQEVKVLNIPSGPPLGIVSADYPSSSISLKGGDRLILLTDGVFDAQNRDGERIGYEKIVDIIRSQRGQEELLQKLVDYVNDFSRGLERADDLTMVEVKWGRKR
jgi:sigma-B regulation protein RsbU (phosphoserine phosphatase)